jgi:hypothetical protein
MKNHKFSGGTIFFHLRGTAMRTFASALECKKLLERNVSIAFGHLPPNNPKNGQSQP